MDLENHRFKRSRNRKYHPSTYLTGELQLFNRFGLTSADITTTEPVTSLADSSRISAASADFSKDSLLLSSTVSRFTAPAASSACSGSLGGKAICSLAGNMSLESKLLDLPQLRSLGDLDVCCPISCCALFFFLLFVFLETRTNLLLGASFLSIFKATLHGTNCASTMSK